MKLLKLCLLLLFPALIHAQDTLRIADHTFKVGDKVKFGYGTLPSRSFAYIQTSPLSLAGQTPLPASYNGLKGTIKYFREMGNRRTGKKYYIVIGIGSLINYWCDAEAAIVNKEIIVE